MKTMDLSETADTKVYKVVVNHEEQYAIWPAAKPSPLGWMAVGKHGIKTECLAHIRNVWTDMRPLSLRKKMEMAVNLEEHGSGSPRLSKSDLNRPLFNWWNDSQPDYARDLCVHDLFEAQAARRPEAIAVIFDNQRLTYRELDARANQLAHYLQKCGVGPEVVVGICVERSVEMMVAILGVLKAGGSYLALDPAYPEERLTFMVEDAEVLVLLTQAHLTAGLLGRGTRVVCLDTDWAEISHENADREKGNVSGENLAYVMYTSGSTGKPKGVMITHSTLSHLLYAIEMPLGITVDEVYLHTASFMFVMSVRQWMVPLCRGGTVVIATSAQIKDPLALFDLIKRRHVTTMDVVPSYWRSCIQTLACLEPERRIDLLNNKLRQIVSGGEPLSSDLLKEWTSSFRLGARLFNVFGQTETSGPVTVYPIPAKCKNRANIIPIGRPVANTQTYVLDSNLCPVSVGASGELHIAGLSLARGYLKRPDLTAEKFIPHPFSNEPGARLYKTGDLAHILPDGTIGFVGRIDYQVKIRGFRVELEEVEAVLRQHPGVREAVVVPRDVSVDEKCLAAYLVFKKHPAPTIRELRSFITTRLPDYMVPWAFVPLESLPRTPGGKVNRQALPVVAQARPESISDNDTEMSFIKRGDIDDWFYIPSWERSARFVPVKREDGVDKKSCWVVFVDACGLGLQIVKRLEQQGHDVFTVTAGSQSARVGNRAYAIDPRRQDGYVELLEELRRLGKTPTRIAHLWSVTSNNDTQSGGEDFEKSQDLGFYSLLLLAQALGNRNITEAIQITVVSSNMQEVTGDELLCPEKATVLGPCKVIPQEQPNITCRSIDLVLPKTGSREEERLVDELLAEFAGEWPETLVAYRGNYRWAPTFKPARFQKLTNGTTRLRKGGVYLVTGGLGGIGLTLAEYLARTVQAKLILVGRSAFPPRDTWEQWLATHDDNNRVSHKIAKLKAIEELGAEILVVSADVTSKEQVQAMFAETFRRFRDLHGVIHAAGIRGMFSTIQDKTREIVESVLAPKVRGTLVMESVLENRKLDFLVLCSSLASILGRIGQVDYCAANAFLNAFAYHNTRRGTFTVSINWDTWQDAETSLNTAMSPALKLLLEEDLKSGISFEEGLKSFIHTLRGNDPQTVISKRNLPARLGQQNARLDGIFAKTPAGSHLSKQKYQRLELETANVAPRTDVEQIIASAWKKVLGVERISIHDNFFDLGGHSLSAARLCVQLQKDLGRNITLSTFFRAPTVEGLARMLFQTGSSKDLPSIVALQTGGPRPPFFCVPVGQGSVHVELGEIARLLGQDQPFYGFQNLVEHPSSIEARAARYIEEIRSVQPVGPYLLGGICLGGVVAFEMAQQLVTQGAEVPLVALIEPGWPLVQSLPARCWFAASIAGRMARTSGRYLLGILGRASPERRSYARLLTKSLCNVWALRRYEARMYPANITLFLAENSFSESRGLYRVPWPDLARGGVQILLIPGGRHEISRAAGYVPEESQLRVLAQKLRTCIDDTLKTSAHGYEERRD